MKRCSTDQRFSQWSDLDHHLEQFDRSLTVLVRSGQLQLDHWGLLVARGGLDAAAVAAVVGQLFVVLRLGRYHHLADQLA